MGLFMEFDKLIIKLLEEQRDKNIQDSFEEGKSTVPN
jgi:hypothetical protein